MTTSWHFALQKLTFHLKSFLHQHQLWLQHTGNTQSILNYEIKKWAISPKGHVLFAWKLTISRLGSSVSFRREIHQSQGSSLHTKRGTVSENLQHFIPFASLNWTILSTPVIYLTWHHLPNLKGFMKEMSNWIVCSAA